MRQWRWRRRILQQRFPGSNYLLCQSSNLLVVSCVSLEAEVRRLRAELVQRDLMLVSRAEHFFESGCGPALSLNNFSAVGKHAAGHRDGEVCRRRAGASFFFVVSLFLFPLLSLSFALSFYRMVLCCASGSPSCTIQFSRLPNAKRKWDSACSSSSTFCYFPSSMCSCSLALVAGPAPPLRCSLRWPSVWLGK